MSGHLYNNFLLITTLSINDQDNFTCTNGTFILSFEAQKVLNNVYYSLMIAASALSMIGCGILISLIVKYKLNLKVKQLLVYLSISDFFIAFFNILGIIW